MVGGQIDPPLADYRTLILGDAPNGLIFHNFVPFNIRKVLGRPFLGFLSEISKKFFPHIIQRGDLSIRVKMHLFLCPFLDNNSTPKA